MYRFVAIRAYGIRISTRAGSAGGPPRKVRKSRKFSITGVDSESPALLLSLVYYGVGPRSVLSPPN